MNFNFKETANQSQSNIRKQLEGNAIYDVIFDGCEAREFNGQQDPTKVYHVLDIKFHNNEGVFTHTIWEPKEDDYQDRQTAFGIQPSNVKVIMYTIKHLFDAVNPELSKKIDNGEESINFNSWKELCQYVVNNSPKNIETKIKLIKNNKGDAMFPYFLSYNRKGEIYMSTNFIGKNIFFTNKELTKIKNSNKTPNNISNVDDLNFKSTINDNYKDMVTTSSPSTINDFDLDI